MKCLALYLTAPLQSWGVGAKFDERPTMSFPSRSGILGLLGAACGIDRSDDAWLERTSTLNIVVRAYCHEKRDSDGSRLTDYHTVGGKYDKVKEENNPWSFRMAVRKADQEVSPKTKTEITHRDYLQDAAFGVVVSGAGDAETLIRDMAIGLSDPVWGVWLGRKCCVPTEPVLVGEFADEEDAWTAINERAARAGRAATMAMTEVSPNSEEREDALMDVPVSFARREFVTRTVAYPSVTEN